jgi:ADP-heptose:LPS heptosyltransferase
VNRKVLIVRFSSFGDIVHARSICKVLKKDLGVEKLHWLIRSDLDGAISGDKYIDRIIPFERKLGLVGLLRLSKELAKEDYDFVYDAHNNVRSFFVRTVISLFSASSVVVRPKDRLKRIMLFVFGLNLFSKPYKAMESYWRPLQSFLGVSTSLSPIEWPVAPTDEQADMLREAIVIVPSTAWPMKSWPQAHWEELILLLPEQKFIILGGPEDDFCESIKSVAPERVSNLAGKLSLKESSALAAHASFLISADTGLQQVADLAGVNGLSLMGPSAFGFTTMGSMKTMEVDLKCRPCSKDGSGKCSQDIYQKCMVEITPSAVAKEVENFLGK